MQQTQWQSSINRRARHVALKYFLVAGLWIWFSDQALERLAVSAAWLLEMQTLKGMFFISVTTGLLYYLVRRSLVQERRRHQAEHARVSLEEHHRATMVSAPLPVFTLDQSGQVLFWNPAAAETFGWSDAEAEGQRLPCVPPEEWDSLNTILQKAYAGEPQLHLPVRWRRRDGFRMDLYLDFIPVTVKGGTPAGVLVMADTAVGHQLLAEGRALLSTIDTMLLAGAELPEALQSAADQMAQMLHCEAAWVGCWSDLGSLNRFTHVGGPPDLLVAVTQRCLAPGACHCPACRASQSGEAVHLLCDLDHDQVEKETLSRYGVRSAMILPLSVQGRVAGIAAFYSRTTDLSEPVHAQLLHLFADRAASAIQNSTQIEQIRLQTAALESAAFAVVITNRDGTIQWVNPFFTRLTGYTSTEVLGENPRLLNSGLIPRSTFTKLWSTILAGYSWRGEMQNRRKNGSVYTEEQTITPVRNSAGEITHFVAVKQDVTERNQHQEQLRFLTTHDALTGLANRQLLSSRLTDLTEAGETGTLVALDVDGLQLINDTRGYERGDEILQAIANTLKEIAPAQATVARCGNDEFTLLLPGLQPKDGQALVERFNELVAQGGGLADGNEGAVSLSAGIVPLVKAADPDEALLLAQLVLREARTAGRGQIRLLMDAEGLEQYRTAARWGMRLVEATHDGSLTLHYQPVVDLAQGRVVHAEALIRLVHEDGSLVPAGSFLQAAEEFRFMREIDRWVLARVLQALEKNPDLHLFMNLSGQSLGDLAQLNWIAARVRAAGSVADRLTFEITETVAVSNQEQLRSWMEEMTAMGCRFALDDLGQGFSSLSYLTNLPLSYVKIDGSFVADLPNNPKNQLVVEALSRIASSMGLQVVAEWVEDEATMTLLQEIGIQMGQGFYLGRPAPLQAVLDRLPVPAKVAG